MNLSKLRIRNLMFDLFVNRKDAYAKQSYNPKTNKKEFFCVKFNIDSSLIESHLDLITHLGVYQLNKENKVKWVCFDFDKNTLEDFETAKKLYDYLKTKGFNPLAENSGGGLYKVHIWIFCKPVEAIKAREWGKQIILESRFRPHELFPKQDNITEFGNLVKLPLGLHLVTKNKSYFYDSNFEPIFQEESIANILVYHYDHLDNLEFVKIAPKPKEVIYQPSNLKNNDWDEFFNYILNNDLPEGLSKEKTIGNKEGGVNNNILKNLSIWFFQKGYTSERLDSEIKPIYEKHGWSFAWLRGWFTKAQKGELKDICTGELVLYAQTYCPELLNLIPSDEKPKGLALSINIERMAERRNFKSCPVCSSAFKFNIPLGRYACPYCKTGGDIKYFARMIAQAVNK